MLIFNQIIFTTYLSTTYLHKTNRDRANSYVDMLRSLIKHNSCSRQAIHILCYCTSLDNNLNPNLRLKNTSPLSHVMYKNIYSTTRLERRAQYKMQKFSFRC